MENLCDTCKYANEDICGCDGEPLENINSEECCGYSRKSQIDEYYEKIMEYVIGKIQPLIEILINAIKESGTNADRDDDREKRHTEGR